jgi:hypothetical protein
MEVAMLKRMLFGAILATFAVANSVQAKDANRTAPAAIKAPEARLENVKIPGTDYEIDFTKKQSGGLHPSQSLIKAIKRWLSLNFNLRASYPDPIIQLASAETILPLRYRGFLSDWPRDIVFPGQQLAVSFEDMMSSRHHDNLIAVYDDEMKTIYLPENWTGNTPAELSVLVHEMVHHLQSATPTRYECPQAREELAYIAQETWLTLFGLNLQDQFNIDPLTFVVSTRCIY